MVASIPAGKKKHFVRHMRDLSQMDGGRTEPMPVEIAKFWAWIQPLSGNELTQMRQSMPEVTHRVKTDWRLGVQAGTDWLEHGTADRTARLPIFSAVNVNEDNTVLELLCVEQTGGG